MGCDPVPTPRSLAAFAAWLDPRLRPTTINQYLSRLGRAHAFRGISSTAAAVKSYEVQMTLRGIFKLKRCLPEKNFVRPPPVLLEDVIRYVEILPTTYLEFAHRAVAVVAFYATHSLDELLPDSRSDACELVLLAGASLNSHGLTLQLPRHTADPLYRHSTAVTVPRAPDEEPVCPAAVVSAFIKHRRRIGYPDGPLFLLPGGLLLIKSEFIDDFRHLTDRPELTAYSFRTGAATALDGSGPEK
ncbi:hypothetical protein H9P43_006765 [Blastocladiella emersonii ATCC 22665]|nr:hypothetical protein H9P43_006765 [Blastocladiella emersonii ATCC 22665]